MPFRSNGRVYCYFCGGIRIVTGTSSFGLRARHPGDTRILAASESHRSGRERGARALRCAIVPGENRFLVALSCGRHHRSPPCCSRSARVPRAGGLFTCLLGSSVPIQLFVCCEHMETADHDGIPGNRMGYALRLPHPPDSRLDLGGLPASKVRSS